MTTDTVGGVWTYALELSRALEPHGIEIVLATMGAALTAQQRADATTRSNVRLRESEYKLEWMPEPWADVDAAGEWLLELERCEQPHVVHLNGYAHGALNWNSPTVIVGHSCVLSWWRAVKGEAAPPSWDQYRAMVTRGIQKADLVIAPSNSMLAMLREEYAPLPPARVIHNAQDPRQFKSFSAKEPVILSAGRLWDEAKNLSALERVAGDVRWPICVAGDGQSPDGSSVATRRTRPLGKLTPEQLIGWLGRASIYVHPARYEPFGLSVLEAAMAGCALVLGDIASLQEIWADAAIFVPPDDTQALQAALEGLIEDAPRRHALARRALDRARRYLPERMAAEYLKAYRSVLGRGSTASFKLEGTSCAL